MSMRTASFARIAGRLREATTALEKWAPIVQAVADERPAHVAPVAVQGVDRPVEAVVLARETTGISRDVDAFRRAVIQAVLHAENALALAKGAERSFVHGPVDLEPKHVEL